MLATPRSVTALTLVGVLLCGSTAPALATDRPDSPAADVTLTTPALMAPTVSALSPSIFDDAVQRPPLDVVGPRDERSPGMTTLRRGMYVSFATLQIMDAVSTRRALDNGAREANPAMAGIAKNGAAMFAVKAGTAVATTLFAEKLAKKHPKRAAILMGILNAGYAAIVLHNYRAARQ